MLESASMTVSSTVSTIAGTISALWTSLVTTVGIFPAILLTVAFGVGAYVSIKWLWAKGKELWNKRGAKVNNTGTVTA